MDEITISIDFMKSGVALAVPLVLFGGLMHIATKSKFIEGLFAFLKAFYYGALALFMLKYAEVNKLGEVDAITAFTCIFCALECGDNAYKVLCMLIQFVKDLIHVFKKK